MDAGGAAEAVLVGHVNGLPPRLLGGGRLIQRNIECALGGEQGRFSTSIVAPQHFLEPRLDLIGLLGLIDPAQGALQRE